MFNHTDRHMTTYDNSQRKQAVVSSVGKMITYSYDALSRKSQMQVQEAGIFTYSYDDNSRLSVVENPQSDRTSFSYDAAGRRILKELANGTRATYLYDPAGNMTRIANLKSDNSVISQFDYTYDPVGNKIRISTAAGGVTTYSYDNTYRLTEEHRTGPNAYQNTYNYDPTGNRILTVKDGARTTSTFDPANQNIYSEIADGRITYTFDQSGNRTGVFKPDGSRTTTTYDYENRNIVVQLPTSTINTMAYDPDGLRVLLQDSTGTTKFLYDNQQYLLQTNGSNVIVAVQTQEPGAYSNLISQYRLTNGVWLPSYHHYDALGNTTELTDNTKNATDTYDYNAWGEILARTGTTLNPFQYRGRYGYFLVTDTGEVYVIMRTYSPATGTWTTLDILRFVNGLNRYLAVFVPNGLDPSGLARCDDECPPNATRNKKAVEVRFRPANRRQQPGDLDAAESALSATDLLATYSGPGGAGIAAAPEALLGGAAAVVKGLSLTALEELSSSSMTPDPKKVLELAGKAETAGMRDFGVAIWVNVSLELCEGQTCCLLWTKHVWKTTNRWHRCSAGAEEIGGAEGKLGFPLGSNKIATAIAGCLQETIKAF